MKKNASQFVARDYNIIATSKNYMESFLLNRDNLTSELKSGKQHGKIKEFTIFDKWFLPNLIAVQLKKMSNLLRK